MSLLKEIAIEVSAGVFHAKSWDSVVDGVIMNELIGEARKSEKNKARLCLHTDVDSITQMTYLAFVNPYEDFIHNHPWRPEILVPIIGRALRRTYDAKGELIKEESMEGGTGVAFATPQGIWHSVKVLSEYFVMIEVGQGPFKHDSTVLLSVG